MKVLITGGAGYIGSHCAALLEEQGIKTVVFDNLEHGHRSVVPGDFFQGDLLDEAGLNTVFDQHAFDAVLHFAALVIVEESVAQPARYVQTNTNGTLNLLEAMRRHDCRRLIFSSTAAVYGNPLQVPIPEEHPHLPLNPYGLAKSMAEQIVSYYTREHQFRAVTFRYFNAAGREFPFPVAKFREHDTHLLTRVLGAAAGERKALDIYGTDYETPDGTCVRDYIHVRDISRAHAQALDYLGAGEPSTVFNIGSGEGFSVKQVIDVCARVTGQEIPVRLCPRRPGDPATLVAATKKIRELLGWKQQYDTLDSIVESAWRWHKDVAAARA